jgi:hypothetical protein
MIGNSNFDAGFQPDVSRNIIRGIKGEKNINID